MTDDLTAVLTTELDRLEATISTADDPDEVILDMSTTTSLVCDAWLPANGYDPDYPEQPNKYAARTSADLYAEACRTWQS